MNQVLALQVLGDIMAWPNDRATAEFRWLRLMSRIKYDGYQDFLAGMRFIESLANWLQQFPQTDRQVAYDFVRNRLVYIGQPEMLRLVELLYPDHVRQRLVRAVSERLGIAPYRVWADPSATTEFKRLHRSTLYMGLSEGARLDQFRRLNADKVTNEQVAIATQLDKDKWDDLQSNLRESLKDDTAKFAFVYLIDDFVGTGTTFLRLEEGDEWKGKLIKFLQSVCDRVDQHFAQDWVLCVHHYVATTKAKETLEDRESLARETWKETPWFKKVEFSFGTELPAQLRMNDETCPDFLRLADAYYDASIETKHTWKGGTDMRRGFGGCALPLVLEHNTPNNSISLLWADSSGSKGHKMIPLFRRRQRHA